MNLQHSLTVVRTLTMCTPAAHEHTASVLRHWAPQRHHEKLNWPNLTWPDLTWLYPSILMNEWMNENLYTAHKELPHKTLHVHSTRYTQCMHVSSHKLYWPWLLVPALWHCGRSWSRPYWRLHVGPALLSSPCSTLAVQTHQLLLFHGLFELCPFAVKRNKQIKSKGRQHFF